MTTDGRGGLGDLLKGGHDLWELYLSPLNGEIREETD